MDSKAAIGLGIGSILLLLFGKRRKKMTEKIGPIAIDYPISKNFQLSEFLRSDVMPELKHYEPNQYEITNLKRLVNDILQPVRDKYGKVIITSGGRPLHLLNKEGKNFKTLLKEKGYSPAKTSDHEVFAAADISLGNVPVHKWFQIFGFIKSLPSTRQTILYLKDKKPVIIHVAVIYKGHGKIIGKNYAFIKSNGSRIET